MARGEGGKGVGAGAARGRDEQRAAALFGEASRAWRRRAAAVSGGKLKAWLSPPSSTATRGWGRGSTRGAKLLAASVRRGVGDAMHGAEGGDDVRRLETVMDRRGDEIEQPGRDLRVLDVEREGAAVATAA